MPVGLGCVAYELNMVVKHRCFQLGGSIKMSHHEMTWYSFDLGATHLYLCSLCQQLPQWPLFWSLLYILMTSLFLIWSSVIIFWVLPFSVRSYISNFPHLPLFQLTLCNSVKLEKGYCKEGLFLFSCMGRAVTYQVIRNCSSFPFLLFLPLPLQGSSPTSWAVVGRQHTYRKIGGPPHSSFPNANSLQFKG